MKVVSIKKKGKTFRLDFSRDPGKPHLLSAGMVSSFIFLNLSWDTVSNLCFILNIHCGSV